MEKQYVKSRDGCGQHRSLHNTDFKTKIAFFLLIFVFLAQIWQFRFLPFYGLIPKVSGHSQLTDASWTIRNQLS